MAWDFDTKIGKFVDNLSRHIVNNNWILNEGLIDGFSTFLTGGRQRKEETFIPRLQMVRT